MPKTEKKIMLVFKDGSIQTCDDMEDAANQGVGICAKRVDGNYYVLATKSGDLFDPTDSSCNRMSKDSVKANTRFSLVKCDQKTFNYYHRFLRTKFRSDWHLARRSFLND